MYKILLYYKYVELADPQSLHTSQRTLCQQLNLRGRIIIASEGINGTLAGEEHHINQYIAQTQSITELSDIEWKVSYADTQVFPKLKIHLRDEIVTLGVRKTGTDVSLHNKAHYIEPEELLQLYEQDQDFLILDARNQYEASIGKFKNALTPPIDNFREFPHFAKNLESYKHKPIVTYCTGGIRCEKASAYLREQGFTNVRQLHGGVHTYAEKTGGKYFEGELFVFDKRLHVPVNTIDPKVISQCIYCQTPITRYIDCSVSSCGELFICCQNCQTKFLSTCSSNCLQKHKAVQNTS